VRLEIRKEKRSLTQNSVEKNYFTTQPFYQPGREDRCLADLRVTDPRHDKTRIELTKGGLLKDSYRWILDNPDFQRWRDDQDQGSRLLWIHGDPGKGKTMLICGIIDELHSTSGDSDGSLLSYFFCQGTDSRINNATAVLRGLIYMLVDQQQSLMPHLRKKYDHAGKALFEDANAWVALSNIFANILQDPSLRMAYLIIDALDECVTDLRQLLNLIDQNSASSCVKWILSSRNSVDLEQRLRVDESGIKLSLELKENAYKVSEAVNTYIDHCVSNLVVTRGDKVLEDKIRHKIQQKADGTFLWVSFVIEELRDVMSWDVLQTADEMPLGLKGIYRRMLKQIYQLKHGNLEICRRVLSIVTTAYRPLHLQELCVLSDLPLEASRVQSVEIIVRMCGSFLTIRDDIVYVIHQSAKDFLCEDEDSNIFTHGVGAVHHTLFSRSVKVLSETLRCDMYDLQHPGFPINKVITPNPDPLAAARYSCLYWVDHLIDCGIRGNAINNIEDISLVYNFLSKSYLYWLEALSLMKSLPDSIVMITKLENIQVNFSTLFDYIIRKTY
jgi:hypothetical protein